MREILDFFVRNSKWLVFVFWMTAGCFLLFTRNPYQQSVYLTSAGRVAGTVYDATGQVTSYFNLRSANAALNKRNAALQGEVIALREKLQSRAKKAAWLDKKAVMKPKCEELDLFKCVQNGLRTWDEKVIEERNAWLADKILDAWSK